MVGRGCGSRGSSRQHRGTHCMASQHRPSALLRAVQRGGSHPTRTSTTQLRLPVEARAMADERGRGMTEKHYAATDGEATIHSPAIQQFAPDPALIPDPPATPPNGNEPDRGGEVVLSQTRVDQSPRCIAIVGGTQWWTPAEAMRLSRQLAEIAGSAAEQCRVKGYEL